MEVLGATASIIQLVTFAGQVVNEVRRYSKSVKNYPETAAKLVQQLETMGRVLGDLSTLITPPQLQSSNGGAPQPSPDAAHLNHLIGDTVRECEKSLQEVREKIEAAKTSKPESRLKRWSSGFRKRLLWPFTEEETKELIAAFESHERQFLIAVSAATLRKMNFVEEHTKAEQLRLLRKWISTADYTSKYSRSLATRNRKTGGWLLADPTFEQWMTRKANSQIFWLNGIPGCGKTMLTSMVIEHVMPVDPDTVGAYFYCDGTDATTINVSNILRSVLVQLLFHNINKTKPLIARLQDVRVTGESFQPHTSQLQELIIEAASYYTEGTIVIDALDECGRDAREELLPCLTYIVEKVTTLRLFVSSRDEYDVRENLMPVALDYSLVESSPASSLREDIKIYIQDEFDRKPRLRRLGTTLKFQISEKMLQSDNMFRWVQCQVDNITKCRSEEDIHHTLANLPAGLNETYAHALDRIIDQTDILLARHTFQWLIGAKRPLRLSELVAALDIAGNKGPKSLLEEEELLDICGSLITYDPSSHVVRFSHITVQEFLLSGYLAKSERSHFGFCLIDVEHQLSLATLRYLLSDDLNLDDEGISYGRHPTKAWIFLDYGILRKQYTRRRLLLYAARYWTKHLRFVSSVEDEVLFTLVKRLLNTPETYGNYCSLLQARAAKDNYEILSSAKPLDLKSMLRKKHMLYYVIQSGSDWMTRRLIVENPTWVNWFEYSWGHGTPLMTAIRYDAMDILKSLLDHGANPDQLSPETCGMPQWTPLHGAVMKQNKMALDLLIERGAKVNKRYKPAGNQSVLHLAAKSGTAEMVEKLLQAGADPSMLDNNGESPLYVAIARNAVEIVRLLVDGGGNPDTLGAMKSPFWLALGLRSPDIVNALFSKPPEGRERRVLPELGEADSLWAKETTAEWYPRIVRDVIHKRDTILACPKTSVSRSSSPQPLATSNVYHVLWIVRQLLNNDPSSKALAYRILDLAQYWVSINASRNDVCILTETLEQRQPYITQKEALGMRVWKESRNGLEPYVKLTLPRWLPERVIRRIIFRTQSHDQGKLGQPPPLGYVLSDNGTGTWLEATIVGDTHWREVVHVIHQNLPGVDQGRVHTNIWDLTEATPEYIINWLSRPRGPVSIGVYGRAYFEGWVNQVESVEIEVQYAVGGVHVQYKQPSYSRGPPLSELGLLD